MKRRMERGISVMEALAAVALVAIALIPLMSVQVRIQRDYMRQQAVRAEIEAQRNALAVLRDINMMQEPSGSRPLSDQQTLRWQATPKSAVVRSTNRGSGDGPFDVALYAVVVRVDDEDGRAICGFTVLGLGWRSLEDPNQKRSPRLE
jgi:general secretion pathway protein I